MNSIDVAQIIGLQLMLFSVTCVVGVILSIKFVSTEKYKNSPVIIFLAKNKWKVIACSVILFLSGIVVLSTRSKVDRDISHIIWTPLDSAALVRNCLRDAGPTTNRYPAEMDKYCKCTAFRIMESKTKPEYIKSLSLPLGDQAMLMAPLIKGCYDTLNYDISKY
jgi:hypothetical protein